MDIVHTELNKYYYNNITNFRSLFYVTNQFILNTNLMLLNEFRI